MSDLFSPATIDFLFGIGLNPYKSWYEEHKGEYLSEVREPMLFLASSLQKALTAEGVLANGENVRLARITRDARRLRGRPLYRDHVWFSFKPAGQKESVPSFFFEISPAGGFYGMGYFMPGPAVLAAMRRRIEEAPGPLLAIERKLREDGLFSFDPPLYRRPFKGPAPPELEKWYNARELYVERAMPPGPELFSASLPELLFKELMTLAPLYAYFWDFHT